MKFSKILALILAVLMLFGAMPASVIFADETNEKETTAAGNQSENAEGTAEGEKSGEGTGEEKEGEEGEEGEEGGEEGPDYLNQVFYSAEDKLSTMTKYVENDQYEIYVEPYTAEVALRNKLTEEVLFTNPIDSNDKFISANGGTETQSSKDVRKQLLSQLIVNFTEEGKDKTFYSFPEACEREQIKVKNLKNGVRIEYKLGQQETRKLVPRMMEKTRFETLLIPLIEAGADNKTFRKFKSYYSLKDASDPDLTEKGVNDLYATYPITEKMAVYVFDKDATEKELNLVESIIKTYCPAYTYETLAEDHDLVEYVNVEQDTPLFKMSLEYYLDEYGLVVRLPANGISFNESKFQLSSITVLPYLGAQSSDYSGFTFFPDGDGTIIRSEDCTSARTITGSIYGSDYGYQTISASHMENITLPVYGIAGTYGEKTFTKTVQHYPAYINEMGQEVPEHDEIIKTPKDTYYHEQGYLAVIEEGESLASITTQHGAFVTNRYNCVSTTFNPRPVDSYKISDSAGFWSVTSKRKYTGSYQLRVLMLSDSKKAKEKGINETEYYDASYVGMVNAYRDYLEKKGIISKKTEEQVKDDIPLYIESFGAIDVASTFLSFPTTKKVALTTFEDLKSMYNELSEKGISNVIFRLKGFTNGGMNSTVPYHVNFENVVGGNNGYKDFVNYAKEKGFGVYPDFDFMYCKKTGSFDGYSVKTDAIKTIDNRYTRKREYNMVTMTLKDTGMIALSPNVMLNYYDNFIKEIGKLGVDGISASTLGSDLNTDFDDKRPFNREDSKSYVTKLLSRMNEDSNGVMVDAGNAFVYQYVDHILNSSLDSSHHVYASEAIPFIGMVLHGYINFAGSPTNMVGDMKYETLKMIENGSYPYFTLSYENTDKLKEVLPEYYSVQFDIWKEDLINFYNTINGALKDLQAERIVGHEILPGERIPSEEEVARKAADKLKQDKLKEEEFKKTCEERLILERRNAYKAGKNPLSITLKEIEKIVKSEQEVIVDTGNHRFKDYEYTDFTIDNGLIVKVTYENGTTFILNYNSFDVCVGNDKIPALSFIKK